MKIKAGWVFLILALLVISAGCQTVGYSELGRTVPAQDQVAILEQQQNGSWRSRDLTVDFRYARNQGTMELSGTVYFDDHLVYNYNLLRDFHMNVLLLDGAGKVLGTYPVTTQRGDFSPIPFRSRIAVPSSAVAVAFSYDGIAVEIDREGGSPFHFWLSPAQ